MKHSIESFLEDLHENVDILRIYYPSPVMAFTAYIADEIAPLTNVDERYVVHCIKRDKNERIQGEIHGYGISSNEEVLTLYYSIYSDRPTNSFPLLRSDFDKAINRLQGFYNCAIRGAHMDVEENTKEYDAFKFIYDHQAGIMTVRLCVLSNCYINSYGVRDIRIDGKNIEHDVWDIRKIIANLYSNIKRETINLDFEDEFKDFKLPYIEVCPDRSEYKYVSTVFPAKLLYSLYAKYDAELLYGNLRLFLKCRGKKGVNANIRQTLQQESENLLAYNNGIVAIAESFEGKSLSGYIALDKGNESITDDIARTGIISQLFDFRIVNGGQTTACIFDTRKNDKSVNYDSVYVPVKIIIPQQIDSSLVYDIIKNTHIQNRLSPKDYDSCSQFDIKMEELSRSIMVPNKDKKPLYWFYERIRGQYDSEKHNWKTILERDAFLSAYPTNMKFKKNDLAKVWVCWNQSPNEAVMGSFTRTSYYMEYVNNSALIPDVSYYKKSIALLIIYKYLLSRQKNKEYGNGKSSVIAYSMAYLSMLTNGNLNFEKIWIEQDISVEMKSFLDSLCNSIWKELLAGSNAIDKFVLSYSKRKDVYDTIKMTDFGLSIESLKEDVIERGW